MVMRMVVDSSDGGEDENEDGDDDEDGNEDRGKDGGEEFYFVTGAELPHRIWPRKVFLLKSTFLTQKVHI